MVSQSGGDTEDVTKKQKNVSKSSMAALLMVQIGAL